MIWVARFFTHDRDRPDYVIQEVEWEKFCHAVITTIRANGVPMFVDIKQEKMENGLL